MYGAHATQGIVRTIFLPGCMPYMQLTIPEVVKTVAIVCNAETVVRIPDHVINPLIKNYHWGDFKKGLVEVKDQD